jgi:type IV pilus assembly protein PilP
VRTRIAKKIEERKLPLTPLQKIDVGQLKVVGIIISPTGNTALVEDPSHKGYVITPGTYVGSNFGRVSKILEDRVIVEEEVEDFFTGQMRLQPVELRLQKKFGEL